MMQQHSLAAEIPPMLQLEEEDKEETRKIEEMKKRQKELERALAARRDRPASGTQDSGPRSN
jgi:hypothetical protein